jgi:hypothetical protein
VFGIFLAAVYVECIEDKIRSHKEIIEEELKKKEL